MSQPPVYDPEVAELARALAINLAKGPAAHAMVDPLNYAEGCYTAAKHLYAIARNPDLLDDDAAD